MIVSTVKFLLDECAKDCPQRFDCEDSAYESCCMAYKCGLGNTGFAETCDRCDGCLRDFGNGEQTEQPTTLPTSLTDPTECPLCGGIAKVSSITASIDSTATQIEYFCTEAGCMNMFGFTKEFK